MDPEKPTHLNPLDEIQLNRRQVIQFAGVVGGALIAGASLKPQQASGYSSKKDINSPITDAYITSEQTEEEKLKSEIEDYRRSLGLLPAAPEFDFTNASHCDLWNFPPAEVGYNVPPTFEPFKTSLEFFSNYLGPKKTSLLRQFYVTDYLGGYCQFYSDPRTFAASTRIKELELFDKFGDIVLHEVFGHGTDPKLFGGYPDEVRLRIIHGKWRALSQAYNIENTFLEAEGDPVQGKIEREFGEEIAKIIVLQNQSIGEYFSPVLKSTDLIEEARNINNLTDENSGPIFTKKVCGVIGHKIIEAIRTGSLGFRINDNSEIPNLLQKIYTEVVDKNMVETYADMVKNVLDASKRKKLEGNTEIIEGIKEIFLSLGMDEETFERGVKAKAIPQDIIEESVSKAYSVTSILTDKEPSKQVQSTPLITEALKVEQEVKVEATLFNQFKDSSIIPDNVTFFGSRDRSALTVFLNLYHELLITHPELRDVLEGTGSEAFDPQELHAWQSDELQSIVATSYLYKLFKNGTQTAEDSEALLRATVRLATLTAPLFKKR